MTRNNLIQKSLWSRQTELFRLKDEAYLISYNPHLGIPIFQNLEQNEFQEPTQDVWTFTVFEVNAMDSVSGHVSLTSVHI